MIWTAIWAVSLIHNVLASTYGITDIKIAFADGSEATKQTYGKRESTSTSLNTYWVVEGHEKYSLKCSAKGGVKPYKWYKFFHDKRQMQHGKSDQYGPLDVPFIGAWTCQAKEGSEANCKDTQLNCYAKESNFSAPLYMGIRDFRQTADVILKASNLHPKLDEVLVLTCNDTEKTDRRCKDFEPHYWLPECPYAKTYQFIKTDPAPAQVVQHFGTSKKYVIASFTEKDAGKYQCVALNYRAAIGFSAEVTVAIEKTPCDANWPCVSALDLKHCEGDVCHCKENKFKLNTTTGLCEDPCDSKNCSSLHVTDKDAKCEAKDTKCQCIKDTFKLNSTTGLCEDHCHSNPCAAVSEQLAQCEAKAQWVAMETDGTNGGSTASGPGTVTGSQTTSGAGGETSGSADVKCSWTVIMAALLALLKAARG